MIGWDGATIEARCKTCGQNMLTTPGCTVDTVVYDDGTEAQRIPYGHEDDWTNHPVPDRCHDCAATPGHHHHASCDVEQCPRCGGQLLTCSC